MCVAHIHISVNPSYSFQTGERASLSLFRTYAYIAQTRKSGPLANQARPTHTHVGCGEARYQYIFITERAQVNTRSIHRGGKEISLCVSTCNQPLTHQKGREGITGKGLTDGRLILRTHSVRPKMHACVDVAGAIFLVHICTCSRMWAHVPPLPNQGGIVSYTPRRPLERCLSAIHILGDVANLRDRDRIVYSVMRGFSDSSSWRK